MAQPLGRDPSRPFAVLAAPQRLGVSNPNCGAWQARQSDATRLGLGPAFGRSSNTTPTESARVGIIALGLAAQLEARPFPGPDPPACVRLEEHLRISRPWLAESVLRSSSVSINA